MKRIDVTLVSIDDRRHTEGIVTWARDGNAYVVTIEGPNRTVAGTGPDAFEALTRARSALEGDGWLVAVEGARPDRWPSGMARDMGMGLRVYRLETLPDGALVETFAPTDPTTVTTVDEQRAAAMLVLEPGTPTPQNPSGGTAPPAITDAMAMKARAMPGGNLYAVDPGFDPDGVVPPEGIQGAFPVDDHGTIVDAFIPNPNYRPTPAALGFPKPTDPVDDVAQRAVTGWASLEDLARAVAEVPVWAGGRRGRRAVLYTAPAHVAADGAQMSRPIDGHAFIDAIDEDTELFVNPGSRSACVIPVDALLRAREGP